MKKIILTIAAISALVSCSKSDVEYAQQSKIEIKEMKFRFDSAEHGGAPLLGISKPVIKAHGSSNAKAFRNAIRQAIACERAGVVSIIAEEAQRLSEEKKKAKEAE